MRVEAAAGWDEGPCDEYLRVCRQVTMLQSAVTELVGRIDSEGLYQDEGYLSAAALLRDRAGVSAGVVSCR